LLRPERGEKGRLLIQRDEKGGEKESVEKRHISALGNEERKRGNIS